MVLATLVLGAAEVLLGPLEPHKQHLRPSPRVHHKPQEWELSTIITGFFSPQVLKLGHGFLLLPACLLGLPFPPVAGRYPGLSLRGNLVAPLSLACARLLPLINRNGGYRTNWCPWQIYNIHLVVVLVTVVTLWRVSNSSSSDSSCLLPFLTPQP